MSHPPAPPRQPRQNGRLRKQGARLPRLPQLINGPAIRWKTVTIAPWYSQRERRVQLASATAVWYHSGLPPVPIRWVLIHDLDRKLAPQALLSTKLDCDPVQILTWFVQRWPLETAFEEASAHLSIETSRQWNDRRVARTDTHVIWNLLAGNSDGCPPARRAAYARPHSGLVS
jgi:hypothetical protein